MILVEIVYSEPHNFSSNALASARAVLSIRKLAETDIQNLISILKIEKEKKTEKEGNENTFLKFFFPLIYLMKKKSDKMKTEDEKK